MAGVEGSPGFYTFVRHFGKMGPPSSLLFLTVDRGKMEGYRRKKDERQHQPILSNSTAKLTSLTDRKQDSWQKKQRQKEHHNKLVAATCKKSSLWINTQDKRKQVERTGQRLLKRDYFVVIVHNKTEYMFSSEENSVSRSRNNACSTTRN